MICYFLFGIVLPGCAPAALPPCPRCVENDDNDGDGYTPAEGDCDDAVADVNPDAVETCNGRDDDCDGGVDLDAADVGTWYADADGDGYGAGEALTGCDPGDGWATRDGDCVDEDAAVSPEAEERCDNQVDDNCDGDDDGCVWRGSVELGAADALLLTDQAQGGLGGSMALLPDQDGDGDAELLVGAPGWSSTFTGAALRLEGRPTWADARAEDLAAARVEGFRAGDALGSQVGVGGDFLAVRSTGLVTDVNGGVVHLLDPGVAGIIDDPDEAALGRFAGQNTEQLGRVLAMAPDGGLLLSSATAGRAAWWMPVPPAGEHAISEVGHAISADGSMEALVAHDLDGDGVVDLVFGEPEADVSGRTAAGRVHLLAGPIDSAVDLDDAEVAFAGPDARTRAGGALAALPDLDGDGRAELFVASPDGEAGACYLLRAGESTPWLTLDGTAETGLGRAAAVLDLDGDGTEDLAVGAPEDARAGDSAGAVLVQYGPLAPGTLDLATVDLVFTGEGANHQAGAALLGGDVDGDGVGDLLIGAPGESSLAENGGAVVLVLGRGW